MDDYKKVNRELWNAWTPVHRRSEFYDVEGFKAGKTSLREIELGELGDVSGKSLLHLQCHFGLDTLSWARLGARATGVDFSDTAIDEARALAEELDIPAQFVCADIYDLPERLDERFDIVFTSYGVLWWLSDIPRWAEIVASFVKPGGIFYIVELHPLLHMLDDDGEKLTYPYFADTKPVTAEESGTYAEPDADVHGRSHGWPHGIGEITTALIAAGLRVEYLHEFDFSPYGCFAYTERIGPDRYCVRGLRGKLPMAYSIRSRRSRRG